MKRKTDRDYIIETKELTKEYIAMQKEEPIRESAKEKREYLKQELEETKAIENKTEFDKHREYLLSKLV